MNPMSPLPPLPPLPPEDGDGVSEMPETPLETSAVPLRRPVALAPPAPPLERVDPLNLAGRPFLNSRPVVRVSLLLWALGLLLLLANVSLFWSYRERSADKREQIAKGEAEIKRQQAVATDLQHHLDSFELEAQNQRIEFLNKQIQERTFSWSQLLDRIAERLPNDVRLNRLTPLTGKKAEQQFQRSSGSRRAARGSDRVTLSITGESRNDEALSSFVRRLFQPPFADPNLIHEEREEDGKTLKFELTVQYRPDPPPSAPAADGTGGSAAPPPRIEELPMPGATPAPSPLTSTPTTPPPAPGGRP
ncbi:MAG TPA: PilN domain-containing protein [Thermoanaerobaculia bacterium]|jgi:Tfp pilus assembly protein PilN|nr:PilN domain-containing protein [Thermoanaerobaculia bacterium]